jgi:iron complex transport system substrate-binding protein
MCLEPVVTVPSLSSYKSDAIRIAGGAPMPVESEYEYPSIELVDILAYNPEVILMCGRQSEEETKEMCPGCNAKDPPCQWTRAMIINDSVLSDTIAAKTGRVYITPCEFLCRPGPRLIEGIEYLSRLLKE